MRGFIPLPVQDGAIADTWRTNRLCPVVHVAEIHREETTRQGEALMRRMLWTTAAHVERPSWQLDTEHDNILRFTLRLQ